MYTYIPTNMNAGCFLLSSHVEFHILTPIPKTEFVFNENNLFSMKTKFVTSLLSVCKTNLSFNDNGREFRNQFIDGVIETATTQM